MMMVHTQSSDLGLSIYLGSPCYTSKYTVLGPECHWTRARWYRGPGHMLSLGRMHWTWKVGGFLIILFLIFTVMCSVHRVIDYLVRYDPFQIHFMLSLMYACFCLTETWGCQHCTWNNLIVLHGDHSINLSHYYSITTTR